MDLFNINSVQNILPFEGEVLNYGLVLDSNLSALYFNKFLEAAFWEHDELIVFGKHLKTNRKVAWFGDQDYQYSYSNSIKKALKWTKELISLKEIVELKTGEKFNSCLLNLYNNGNEGMGWHSDNEKELGEQPVIASLSLGAARKFLLKHNQTKDSNYFRIWKFTAYERRNTRKMDSQFTKN